MTEEKKIRVYDLKAVLLSLAVAIVCAVLTGKAIHRQASPNFDEKEVIVSSRTELPEMKPVPPPELKHIGASLGAYNRKILNARLLNLYSMEEHALIEDAYLKEVVPQVNRLARIPLAGERGGMVVASLVAAFSTILYFNLAWVAFTAVRLIAVKLINRG